jgi:ATP-dependent Lon protease
MSDAPIITLPVLPLRDIVVFPHMIVPLFVGREKSIKALEAVMAQDKQIILVTQKEAALEDPDASGLFATGTIGTVLQLLKLPDGAVKVLVEGGERVLLISLVTWALKPQRWGVRPPSNLINISSLIRKLRQKF